MEQKVETAFGNLTYSWLKKWNQMSLKMHKVCAVKKMIFGMIMFKYSVIKYEQYNYNISLQYFVYLELLENTQQETIHICFLENWF